MAFELTIRFGDIPVASGRFEPGETRLELALPRLSAAEVPGRLEVRLLEEGPISAASASCISEWVRCGDAVLEGDRVAAPLTFTSQGILGALDRPHETTLYLTIGTHLLRAVLRIPSLVPAGAPEGAVEEGRERGEGIRGTEPLPSPQPAAQPAIDVPPVALPSTLAPPPSTAPTTPIPPPSTLTHPPSTAPLGAFCRNHPDVPTQQFCAWCRNPFCDHCLVELRGSRLCAWCKQAALVQMQRAATTVDPGSVVLWARIYDIVMVLGALMMLGLQVFSYTVGTSSGFYGALYGGNPVWTALGFLPGAAALVMALPPAIGLGPGKRWAYTWQMVMLVPSMLVACFWASCLGFVFWPAAIILLIYWVKPEVKEYCETGA